MAQTEKMVQSVQQAFDEELPMIVMTTGGVSIQGSGKDLVSIIVMAIVKDRAVADVFYNALNHATQFLASEYADKEK